MVAEWWSVDELAASGFAFGVPRLHRRRCSGWSLTKDNGGLQIGRYRPVRGKGQLQRIQLRAIAAGHLHDVGTALWICHRECIRAGRERDAGQLYGPAEREVRGPISGAERTGR